MIYKNSKDVNYTGFWRSGNNVKMLKRRKSLRKRMILSDRKFCQKENFSGRFYTDRKILVLKFGQFPVLIYLPDVPENNCCNDCKVGILWRSVEPEPRPDWSVVYFNQLSSAVRTQKLVEILFFSRFQPFLFFLNIVQWISVWNHWKTYYCIQSCSTKSKSKIKIKKT